MMNPLISVVVPTYNVEKYIEKCILSVLNQDIENEYEVLVIDDCGHDASIQIVEALKQKHSRGNIISIIHHDENKGLGPSRNTGIDHAHGDYIFFLDSDDWISPNCLSLLLKNMEDTQADVVVGSVCRIEDVTNNILSQNIYHDTLINQSSAGIYAIEHQMDYHIEVWNKLYRTAFLRDNGVRFIHRIFEDYYFDFRFRALSHRICLIPDVTLYYNVRQNSILTTLKASKGSDESVKIFCEIVKVMQKMITEEFSDVDNIYDLYMERSIWILENFERYTYTKDQWDYIRHNISDMFSFIPSACKLNVPYFMFIYNEMGQDDDLKKFYILKKIYIKKNALRSFIGTAYRKVYTWVIFQFLGKKCKAREFEKQRAANQLHCYDYPAESNGWQKIGDAPVYGDETTGTVFDPYVLKHDGVYLMVGSARKTRSLILLQSNDGVKWRLMCTLLSPVANTWESTVNRGCLVLANGVWHLWYTGQNKGKSTIGHLTSDRYDSFIRSESNQPVMVPTLKVEGVSVMNPCVIWDADENKFKMWYSAGENYEPDVIFYAESEDGCKWMKREEPVLTKFEDHPWEQYKVGGCQVLKNADNTYTIYYIGYQNLDVTRICYAHSKDGIAWERPDKNICLSPSKDSWDADACYKPSVVTDGNSSLLWYNGRKSHCEYIGLATKYH